MSVEPAHLVGIGGAIGAILRYAIAMAIPHDKFPFATLLVNVVGSFVLGVLIFAGAGNDVVLFVGVGACGSFTTYSSFSVEVIQLWEDGSRLRAGLYAMGTLCLCLVAIGLAAGLVSVIL